MCVITHTDAFTYSCTATIVHNVSVWESTFYTVKVEVPTPILSYMHILNITYIT